MSEHQATIDRTSPPKVGDPPLRNVPLETLDIKGPTTVVGSDDTIAIWVFPNYFKANALVSSRLYASLFHVSNYRLQNDLTRMITDFATSEMGSFMRRGKTMGAKANGKKRGAPDSYTTDRGLHGAGIYCTAWHPQGHKVFNSTLVFLIS